MDVFDGNPRFELGTRNTKGLRTLARNITQRLCCAIAWKYQRYTVGMAQGHPLHGDSKLTVRYAGDKLDAREVNGKIWFAVDGQAILTHKQQGTWDVHAFKPVRSTGTDDDTMHSFLSCHRCTYHTM